MIHKVLSMNQSHKALLNELQTKLHAVVRTVPNWPKSGVQLRDITPLFQTPVLWAELIAHFVERLAERLAQQR